MCFETIDCLFWTWNKKALKCWLKTSDASRTYSSTGSISGSKACGRPQVSNPSTGVVVGGVVGAVLAAISAVVAGFFAVQRWRSMRSTGTGNETQDVNAMYGTYYNGVEYNTVNDNNELYGRNEYDTLGPEVGTAAEEANSHPPTVGDIRGPEEEEDGYARLPIND